MSAKNGRTKKIIDFNKILIKHSLKKLKKRGLIIADDCRIKKLPDFGTEPYLITIGQHVSISFDVVFLTHDGATCLFRDEPKYKGVIKFGKIEIKDNCFIGARSTIMPGVTIGENSIIGACSLVTKDVPPNSVYAGVPAKYICSTDEYAQKCLDNSPTYDKDAYRRNKREELLKIL